MSALHWLAHNDDRLAIEVLLAKGGSDMNFSRDNNLPIDVAGSTPSFSSVDVLLEFYATQNKLHEHKLAGVQKNLHID